MLRITRRVHRAELSQLMQLRRSNCKNTEGGARARGAMRTAAGRMLSTREADAWGVGARPRNHGATTAQGAPATQRKTSQRGGSRGPSREFRDLPVPSVQVGASRSQASGGPRPRPRKIPPPKKRPPPNPSPAPGQSNRSGGGSRGEGEVRSGRSECSRHADRFPPTQEGCQARYS